MQNLAQPGLPVQLNTPPPPKTDSVQGGSVGSRRAGGEHAIKMPLDTFVINDANHREGR